MSWTLNNSLFDRANGIEVLLRGYYFDVTVTSSASFEDLLNRRTVSEYFLTRHAYDCLNIHELVPVGIGLLLNNVVCVQQCCFCQQKSYRDIFTQLYL